MSGTQRMKKPAVCQDGKVFECHYEKGTFHVTGDMKDAFDWDGCVIVRNLLDKTEVDQIISTLTQDGSIVDRSWSISDGEGRSSRLVIWFNPGEDVTGMVARVTKVAATAEALLDGEVFHFHTKLMMKEACTGGKHLWHQDYGYWYKDGFLRPDLLTAFIPIDKCVKENGCLEVLLGSHRCGRIEHILEAGQQMAEKSRVEEIKNHFSHVYVPLNPGDCLFFHSNLLHTSQKNASDMRRWCFLTAYGRTDNTSETCVHPVDYSPVQKVDNDAIKNCSNYEVQDKRFMDPKKDHTIRLDDAK